MTNKGDLIKRNLAIAYATSGLIRKIDGEDWIRTSEVKQSLNDVPTVEQEVYMTGEDCDLYMRGYNQARKDFERPQGDWIFIKANEEQTDGYECSVCKITYHTRVPYFSEYNFCPNCGAKMKSLKDCTKLHIESC